MATCEVVYDYVEDIDPNLTCTICQSALVDPVTTTSCKHTFCRDCISTALSHQTQCPIDRSALGKGNLQDTEMLVKLMLDELKVKCGSEGCGKVMERGLLLSHSRSCGKTMVRCTEGDCGLMMKREGLARHRAYECFQRRMECEKCKVILTFRHQSDHTHNDSETKDKMVCEHCDKSFGPKDMDKRLHKWTCSKAPIPCTHSSRGCTVVCTRESLASHITQCPFEALSSFFEINDNRLSKLEERNASMSRTIDALNTEMGILRADLSSTKESLASVRRMARDTFISTRESRGILPAVSSTNIDDPVTPRTRTASLPDVFGDTTPRRGASDPLVESSSGQLPTISSPRNGISVSTAADEDEELSVASSISTAFPGRRVGQVIRPNLFMGSRTPLEGPDLARSYADEVFDRLPVGASPEMAISALMSILIRLGTGLDTVDRRARLRAITEILRTQEEIASLRAIVNTLRMQVMIDRPRSFRRPVPIPSLPTQTSETEQATNESSLDPPLPHTPFSSYSLPHWSEGSNANLAGDTGGSDTEGEGGRSRTIPRVRESVLFQQSVNRVSASSTSSLVSTGGRTGRPMGIPPPTPTDFSGIAAMRNDPVPTTNRPRNPIIGLGRRLIQRDRESQPRL